MRQVRTTQLKPSSNRLGSLHPLTWVRLWFSFQRYAFVLTALAVSPLVVVAVVAPTVWWAWLVAVVPALWVGRFAVEVWFRWPRKIRLWRVGVHRIAAGRFVPEDVRTHCGDPCYRVVADELLRQCGVAAAERRVLLARWQAEAAAAGHELIIIDHIGGEVRRVSGGVTTVVTSPLQQQQQQPLTPESTATT